MAEVLHAAGSRAAAVAMGRGKLLLLAVGDLTELGSFEGHTYNRESA